MYAIRSRGAKYMFLPNTNDPETNERRAESLFLIERGLNYSQAQGRDALRLRRFQKKYGWNKGWLKYRFWWFIHNVPAHLAIGLVPCAPTFKFHDWTSKRLTP